jgi:hypothetical protein
MTTGLTLQDKPSVIITDSGLGRSRHTGTVATQVGHTELYTMLAVTNFILCMWHMFEVGNCLSTYNGT